MLKLKIWALAASPYISQLLIRILPMAFGLALSVVVVRGAGVVAFGQYSLLLSLATMTLVLLSNGLDMDCLRQSISNEKIEYSAKIIGGVGVAPLYASLVYWQALPAGPAMLIYIGVVCSVLADTFVVYCRKIGKDLSAFPVRTLPVATLFFVAIATDVGSLEALALLYASAWFIVPVLLFPSLRGVLSKFRWTVLSMRYRSVGLVLISLLMTQLQANIDVLLLNKWLGAQVVGEYRIAFLVGNLGLQAIGVFSAILLSRLATLTSPQGIHKRFWYQMVAHFAIGTCFFVFVMVAYPSVIVPLFKIESDGVYIPLLLISVSAGFNGLSMVISYFLLAHKRDRFFLLITAVAAAISVLGNFLLIPIYGASGAAVASVVSQLSAVLIGGGVLARFGLTAKCRQY